MNGNPSSSPPPTINVWEAASSSDKAVYYVVRHPWQWVMEDLSKDLNHMAPVDNPNNLPLAKQQQEEEQQQKQQQQQPASNSRRGHGVLGGSGRLSRRSPKSSSQGRASLRLEVVNSTTNQVVLAVHGTSACFEGLGDKDELVRTMQRCRCDHLHLSPPSLLIQWDVTPEECHNLVGSTLPVLTTTGNSAIHPSAYAVLKEPMGSQGKGIFFVRNAQEIHEIIDRNHQRASEDPDLLENLIAVKGRIPSWVLQAEVYPALLIRGRRKFHIRSYVIVVERPDDELLDMYIYARHEVRIAGLPIDDNTEEDGPQEQASQARNPLAHITNGALSGTTERVLLDQVPELTSRGFPRKLELFLAQVFGKYLLPDISRRIPSTLPPRSTTPNGSSSVPVRQFAVAGTDVMVTEDLRSYLLEVNVNPAAPPKHLCEEQFSQHLHGFFRDLVNLVTLGHSSPNFYDAFEILEADATRGNQN